jgi:YesN/AraC family two-component response regulator
LDTQKGDRVHPGKNHRKGGKPALLSSKTNKGPSHRDEGAIGKLVFLVDDDTVLRAFLRDILTMQNFRVIEASTCSEAMAKFDPDTDICVIDYQLPDGSGIELLEVIRKTRPFLPVLIMTGYGTEDIATSAFRTGAADYLKKPLEIEFLLLKIAEKLGGETVRDKAVSERAGSEDDFILGWMAMYIEKNHTQDLDLDKLAEKAGMNKFRLCRLFKEKFGMGYLSYLNNIRTAHAKELLRNDALSILNISDHIGFGSLSQFERVFRETEGMSPREYRKKVIKGGALIIRSVFR